MASLETLAASVEEQPNLQASVAYLVDDLAERIKATSNDQNIQKLARDLKAAAPALVRAVANKTASAQTAR